MEHERFDSELDDLLQDIHRLIDEEAAPEEEPLPVLDELDEFDLTGLLDDEPDPSEPLPDLDNLGLSGLFDEEPEPAAAPIPEPETPPVQHWTDKQKVPRHVAKLQKDQDQAYADWLYEQEHGAPAAKPEPRQQGPVATIPPAAPEFQQTRWTDRQKVPRHVAKLQRNQDQAYADWLYEQDRRGDVPPPVFPEETDEPVKKKKKKKKQQEPDYAVPEAPKKKHHGFRNFLIFLLVLSLALTAAVVFLLPKQPTAIASGDRQSGVSTILLIGTDASGARTDTLMLLSADRTAGILSLVSIPRDTLVNGNYAVPKINSVYGANNGGAEGIEMLMTRVEQCIGFRPDGYVLIRLDAFTQFVDLLGGVEFDVPVDMFYNDPSQDLYIALEAGRQTLSGEEAMGLVRFRSGYSDADLGRVQVQRDFLAALMDQAVSLNGIAKSPLLLNLFLDSTETDLTAGNFLWLAETAVLSDLQHVETATLPGTARNFETGSYYVLDPAGVAQTVNTYCNPYLDDITVEDLEIRTS